jgi:predicted AAA+ superfamily ATPase
VLKTSHIVYTIQPYYRNFKKRLVKSSKLYFRDTGLACTLLGINSAEPLSTYYQSGALFENFIFNEVAKAFYNRGLVPPLFYWRDNAQHKIDMLLAHRGLLRAVEIKSSATFRKTFFKQLDWFGRIADVPLDRPTVVYGGEGDEQIQDYRLLSWRRVAELAQD